MITEKMREEFELEWNKVSGRTPERSIAMDGQNSYENRIDDAAWWAWQASRAAIEVELPQGFTHHGASDQTEYVLEAGAVVASIESFGLKVK